MYGGRVVWSRGSQRPRAAQSSVTEAGFGVRRLTCVAKILLVMASTSYTALNGSSAPGPSTNGVLAGPSNGHLSVHSSTPSSPVVATHQHAAASQHSHAAPCVLDWLPQRRVLTTCRPVAAIYSANIDTIVNHLYQAGFRSGVRSCIPSFTFDSARSLCGRRTTLTSSW